jgi:hypothetical protein
MFFVNEIYPTNETCPQCGAEMKKAVLIPQDARRDCSTVEEVVCANPLCDFVKGVPLCGQ